MGRLHYTIMTLEQVKVTVDGQTYTWNMGDGLHDLVVARNFIARYCDEISTPTTTALDAQPPIDVSPS